MAKLSKLPVIGILGTNGTVSRTVAGAANALALAGDNTGNLVYQFGADCNIRGPRVHLPSHIDLDWSEVRRSIDVLHIPAANQLNPEFDISGLAKLADYLDKPIFIAGLGMQCELAEGEQDIELAPGALQFIDVLKRLAPGVGVRGEGTQRLLARHGLTGAVVTGCPSNFINRQISGATIQARLQRAAALPRPRIDFFPGTLSNHRQAEARLRSLAGQFDCRYVLQTNPALFDFVSGNGGDAAREYLCWERAALASTASQEAYDQLYAERATFYFSAPAWIDSVARRDFAIGMRMHGVVATIQGGTAAACVVSDGRIRELVDTMAYPHLTLADVGAAASMRELIERVKFVPAQFDGKRQEAFRNYRQLASESGVQLDETGFSA